MVAALVGVMLASHRARRRRRRTPRKALKLALVAALGIGISLVFLDRRAEHDALTRRRRRPRSSRVPDPGRASSLQRRARAPLTRAARSLAGIGLLDTGANSAFAIATTSGLLSLVAVLGGLFPVVTVALAYFLLHERLRRSQRAGVMLALVGIPLISA